MSKKTDFGPPYYKDMLPPIVAANYGKWKYHEIVKPGVLLHVSETGAKLWSIRAATPRLLSIVSIRKICDLAAYQNQIPKIPENKKAARKRILRGFLGSKSPYSAAALLRFFISR